jgi:phosphoribosylformylglycinamidine synthase subunit PurQ / glutaminase
MAVTAPRVLVLGGSGINCEEETAHAFARAGGRPEIVTVRDLVGGDVELRDYRVLCLPGGFSFGDDLGAGRMLANLLRRPRSGDGRPLHEELRAFLEAGGFILGICNGFQVLVKMGLLPNTRAAWEQEATLARNDSGRFEDRWVTCVVRGRSPVFPRAGALRLPVRHGEGKLVFADEQVRRAVVAQGLDVLAYADEHLMPAARYPENPNGSELACAALTDPTRQVLGLMPHPEANLWHTNDPNWPLERRRHPGRSEEGAGLAFFRNVLHSARERWTSASGALC